MLLYDPYCIYDFQYEHYDYNYDFDRYYPAKQSNLENKEQIQEKEDSNKKS
ncbi:MAG: hypothetical protein GX208_00810 [Firmicutes bacterium]|nr:hypothetical protein [Bacillota bacterium]